MLDYRRSAYYVYNTDAALQQTHEKTGTDLPQNHLIFVEFPLQPPFESCISHSKVASNADATRLIS